MEEDIAMHNPADDIPKSVKRRVMANDRRVMGTYHSVAASTVDDERGGRFAVEGKQTVIGSSAVAYPQQPSTSPWHSDPCPPEPPLGYSVEAMEPDGGLITDGTSEARPEQILSKRLNAKYCELWPHCGCAETLDKWCKDLSDEKRLWPTDLLDW